MNSKTKYYAVIFVDIVRKAVFDVDRGDLLHRLLCQRCVDNLLD